MNVMFFFFFKQKTAYEIYQCDWSSDVCSSDLKAKGKQITETRVARADKASIGKPIPVGKQIRYQRAKTTSTYAFKSTRIKSTPPDTMKRTFKQMPSKKHNMLFQCMLHQTIFLSQKMFEVPINATDRKGHGYSTLHSKTRPDCIRTIAVTRCLGSLGHFSSKTTRMGLTVFWRRII